MSLSLFDNGGPLLDSVYIITCTSVPSVNGSVSLKWINSDNSPVQSRQNLVVGEMFQAVNGSYMINLTFSSIREDDEGLFICHGTLNLFEYPTYSIENTISVNIVAPGQLIIVIMSYNLIASCNINHSLVKYTMYIKNPLQVKLG